MLNIVINNNCSMEKMILFDCASPLIKLLLLLGVFDKTAKRISIEKV